MRVLLTSAPAAEPVRLADVKAELLSTEPGDVGSVDDTLLSCLITAARIVCEARTELLFLTQTWKLFFDALPSGGTIRLPVAPVQTVHAVRTVRESGNRIEPNPNTLRLESDSEGQYLRFPKVTASADRADGVSFEVDVVAGLAARPEELPESLRQAVARLVVHWHIHRQPIAFGDQTIPIPHDIAKELDVFARWQNLQPAA